MEKQQAYKVLGIEQGAIERDVRRAYRALLFDLEDNGQSDPAFPEKKQNLEDAFQICLKEALAKKAEEAPTLASATAEPVSVQRKLLLRVGILVIVTLIVVWGYSRFRLVIADFRGESPTKTVDDIAAIENVGSGSKVVIFRADGKKIDSPKYVNGMIERDIAWRGDGNRLLFISNRDRGNFNVFRWNPGDTDVELRSTTSRAKANLWFGWDPRPENRDIGLLTSGGFVLQYNQKTGMTEQLLPPPTRKAQGKSGEDEGTVSQIDTIYKKIGDSFATAKWGAGRKAIWTVMRREGGEVFVFNPLDTTVNKGMPVALFAGKKIEFDVTPTGDAIVAVRKFEFVDPANVPADMMKDGRPLLPFDSVVFLVPANGATPPAPICHSRGKGMYFGSPAPKDEPIAKLQKGEFTFAQPAVSPDGSMVAIVVAALMGESDFDGQSVVLFPILKTAKIDRPIPAVVGPVSEPAWGPNSDKLVLLQRNENGTRSIYVGDFATRTTNRITVDGDFSSPKFSPQKN